MSRILITGGLGFIGQKLEERLIEEGHEVYIFDRTRISREKYYHGDIIDYFNIENTFEKVRPEIVFHFAAMVSRKECEEAPYMAIATNVDGTLNVVNLCVKYSSRLIYAGSSEEYGDAYCKENDYTVDENTPMGTPTSYYAMTKRMSDEIIQYNTKYGKLIATTVRFCMLYGAESYSEYRSAITRFIFAALDGTPLMAHENTERSWCHINDAVDALILILNHKQENCYEIYNIGREEPISAVDLAKLIVNITKSKSEIKIVPIEPTIVSIKRMKFKHIKNTLGWESKIPLKDGLRSTIEDIIIDYWNPNI